MSKDLRTSADFCDAWVKCSTALLPHLSPRVRIKLLAYSGRNCYAGLASFESSTLATTSARRLASSEKLAIAVLLARHGEEDTSKSREADFRKRNLQHRHDLWRLTSMCQ